MKIYLSFQEQLEDDPEMRQLGVMYGMSNDEQKKLIKDKVGAIFLDYGEQYVKVAHHYLEFVGGMSLIVKQIKAVNK